MKKLGVIADDFTGATDIAGFLVAGNVATIQTNGVPSPDFSSQADAFVISLKSRSCPKDQAIEDSLAALRWLQARGCEQFYFKYCSTFDSTEKGNIGPVTDALMDALGTDMTVVCPALPVNGRTLYKGYLFVNDELLHESGMRNHPLTPMRESKIERVMESQSRGEAVSIYSDIIDEGSETLRHYLEAARREGYRYVVLDSLYQSHLKVIAAAVQDMPLVTGGSGLAFAMTSLEGESGKQNKQADSLGRPKKGRSVIFAGSCSQATNRQVNTYISTAASMKIDVARCVNDMNSYRQEVSRWLLTHLDEESAPLLYATKPPEELEQMKGRYPEGVAEEAIESLFGYLAPVLHDAGVKNFISAGGETSGKIVQSLGIRAFHIGPQIDPGVPWVKAVDQEVYLALKSGNFGTDDFFMKAQKEFL
ncbi:MAG: four-carbon acid sugar kinase family protein [Sphaerochaetaceae bacterium]|nr:four-carbon acid sugar kinase family protein [Sphaerochaetaceae bacterium]